MGYGLGPRPACFSSCSKRRRIVESKEGLWSLPRVKYRISMSFCIVLTPAIARVNYNLDGHASLSSFSICRRDNVGKWKDKSHSLSPSTSGSGSIRKGARRRFCFKSQITVAEVAPATSAAYGILLLAGGVFACMLKPFLFIYFTFPLVFVLVSDSNTALSSAACSYQIRKQRLAFWRTYRGDSYGINYFFSVTLKLSYTTSYRQ